MRCPFCKSEDTKVTDSRTSSESVRRRRECLNCDKRFTTFETIDVSLQVRKRDGTYENFSEDKLISGLNAACYQSKVSHDQILQLINNIKQELTSLQLRVIESKDLGEMVMNYLKKLDIVAYIRFACVYRRFKDIGELRDAIESVAPSKKKKEM